jgi:hypothetical protein
MIYFTHTRMPLIHEIFLYSCGIAVHQMCYGLPALPDGDQWMCDFCEALRMDMILSKHRSLTGQPDNPKKKRAQNGKMMCKLCPVAGGALKECVPRSEGDVQGWVHVSLLYVSMQRAAIDLISRRVFGCLCEWLYVAWLQATSMLDVHVQAHII